MKNKLSNTYLILVIVPFFFSCRGPVKEEKKKTAPESALSLHVGDEKYVPIDTKQSVITWKGTALIGDNAHTGYVYLSKGELMMANDQLLGGTIEVVMNTIEDEGHGKDNNLVNHLKNPDFFDVGQFPFTTMAITKVEPLHADSISITGNLTIKGITNPVTFPAKLEVKDGNIKADAKLVIDRTKWNVRYKSRKLLDVVANQAISDSIGFDIKIVAKK